MNHLQHDVRQNDYDRYLVTLCMSQSARADLWALLAFNHEIAKTRSVVSETSIGHIRLQWWRDRIHDLFDGIPPPDDPVLRALARLIAKGEVKRDDFDTLIHAREFDLEGVLPADITGLEAYVDYTNAPLICLMEGALNTPEDAAIRTSISIGYGIVGLVRAWPIHWAEGACFFPHSLLMQRGINESDLMRREAQDSPAMRAVIRDLVMRATDHLAPVPRTPLVRGLRHVARAYARALHARDYSAHALYQRGRLPWVPVTLALYGAR